MIKNIIITINVLQIHYINTLKNESIYLPSKNNKLDWKYMNKFIDEIKNNLKIII